MIFVLTSCIRPLSENEIVGTWTVHEVNMKSSNNSEQETQASGITEELLLQYNFVFKSDRQFVYMIAGQELPFGNLIWKYESVSGSFSIINVDKSGTSEELMMKLNVNKFLNKIRFEIISSKPNITLVVSKE